MRGGLERLPCDPNAPCPLRESQQGCFEDIHHRQWPRRVYEGLGAVAIAFRELPENKDQRCRNLHNIEHAISDPPEVPDRELMLLAIEEAINTGQASYSKTKLRKIFGNSRRD